MTEQGPRHMADQLWEDGELRTGNKTESKGDRGDLNQVIFSQHVQVGVEELEVSFGLTLPPKFSPQEFGWARLLG